MVVDLLFGLLDHVVREGAQEPAESTSSDAEGRGELGLAVVRKRGMVIAETKTNFVWVGLAMAGWVCITTGVGVFREATISVHVVIRVEIDSRFGNEHRWVEPWDGGVLGKSGGERALILVLDGVILDAAVHDVRGGERGGVRALIMMHESSVVVIHLEQIIDLMIIIR